MFIGQWNMPKKPSDIVHRVWTHRLSQWIYEFNHVDVFIVIHVSTLPWSSSFLSPCVRTSTWSQSFLQTHLYSMWGRVDLFSSSTLQSTLKEDSNAIVKAKFAKISFTIFDNIDNFIDFYFHNSKILKQSDAISNGFR